MNKTKQKEVRQRGMDKSRRDTNGQGRISLPSELYWKKNKERVSKAHIYTHNDFKMYNN